MTTIIYWLILAAYLTIAFGIAVRRIVGQLAWSMYASAKNQYPSLYKHLKQPSNAQWFGAFVFGIPLALLWPLSLLIAYGLAANNTEGKFFYTPPKERERILAERIKELERKAGIR